MPGELHAERVDETLLHPADPDLREVVVARLDDPLGELLCHRRRLASSPALPYSADKVSLVARAPPRRRRRSRSRCSTSGIGLPCSEVPLVTLRTAPLFQSTSATSPSSKASRIPGHGKDGQSDVDAVAQAEAVERLGHDDAHPERRRTCRRSAGPIPLRSSGRRRARRPAAPRPSTRAGWRRTRVRAVPPWS